MLFKLFLSLLFISLSLLAHDISIDSKAKYAKEKVKKMHEFVRDDTKSVVIDKNSIFMWQDDKSVKVVKKSLMDAKAYCYKLILGGFTNWRLPSIEELETIADSTKKSPAINENFKNTISDYYISASPRLSDIDTILYMDFSLGHRYEASRRGRGYIRCVRVTKKKSSKFF